MHETVGDAASACRGWRRRAGGQAGPGEPGGCLLLLTPEGHPGCPAAARKPAARPVQAAMKGPSESCGNWVRKQESARLAQKGLGWTGRR